MEESTVSNELTLHWVPVVDASGRTHLEAVWTADHPVPASTPHAA
jgi:hypothetical protein